jgi:hypothetical protein
MIKLIIRLFFTLSIISCLEGHAAINWTDAPTEEAITNMHSALDISLKEADWIDFSFNERKGDAAVKYLLEQALHMEDWKKMTCTKGCENIFSFLWMAFQEGCLGFEQNSEKAATWLVRSYIIETTFLSIRGLTHVFLTARKWAEESGVSSLTLSSTDADIEAAIKALHEKLVEEAEAEEKDTSD